MKMKCALFLNANDDLKVKNYFKWFFFRESGADIWMWESPFGFVNKSST